MTDSQGLLFVFGEPAPDATEDEFNDWYDNEHAPLRLTVEGFHNAVRYKATDGKTPSWLALYDLATPSVARSEPYKALAAQATAREKALVPRLATLDRRLYELISTRTKPNLPASSFPSKYLFLVSMLVPPALEEEYNNWYEEEHLDLAIKAPGWQRTRRYKLVDHIELTGKINPSTKIHNYIALHEFDNNDYGKSPEAIASVSTPWAAKIRESVDDRSLRNFGLYKNIQKN